MATKDYQHSQAEHFSPYRSDGKLYGFVCIVTGATTPIGKAVVHELAAHGAACVYACSAVPSDDYDSLAAEVNAQHPNTKVIGYPFKLADEQDTLGLIDDVLNAWGRLDIYTTTSALLGPATLPLTTPASLSALLEANTFAPFFALKYAPAAMSKTSPRRTYPNAAPKTAPYGSIIVVGSVAATYGGCGGPGFTMASHAALGVVRAGVVSLNREGWSGVRINCVSPGQVDLGSEGRGGGQAEGDEGVTGPRDGKAGLAGLERAGRPQEVARVVGFLASGFGSYVHGANLVVDGGAAVGNPVMVPI